MFTKKEYIYMVQENIKQKCLDMWDRDYTKNPLFYFPPVCLQSGEVKRSYDINGRVMTCIHQLIIWQHKIEFCNGN